MLRDEWRYPGFVISDWGAVHTTEKAALAELDQESGQELDKAIYFDAPLANAVAAGRVPEARLDQMVERILTGGGCHGGVTLGWIATVISVDIDVCCDTKRHVE